MRSKYYTIFSMLTISFDAVVAGLRRPELADSKKPDRTNPVGRNLAAVRPFTKKFVSF